MAATDNQKWSSPLTFVLAAVGCAVGLGNIWLFPFLAGVNGGGAFVLVYLIAVPVLALPVLIAELLVGRRGAAGPPQASAAVGDAGVWVVATPGYAVTIIGSAVRDRLAAYDLLSRTYCDSTYANA